MLVADFSSQYTLTGVTSTFCFLRFCSGNGMCISSCGTGGGLLTSGKFFNISHKVLCNSPALYKDKRPLMLLVMVIYPLQVFIHQFTLSSTRLLAVHTAFSKYAASSISMGFSTISQGGGVETDPGEGGLNTTKLVSVYISHSCTYCEI